MDLYIWTLSSGGKGENGCFFGLGSLASEYRKGDRTLFQRLEDGEVGSRPPELTPEMLETVRQLALSEARGEAEAREAALKAEMEEMRNRQNAEIEEMKRQSEMESQMQQFFLPRNRIFLSKKMKKMIYLVVMMNNFFLIIIYVCDVNIMCCFF